MTCEHHAVMRKGQLRCAKCHARYVIDINGARWIERRRPTAKAA